MQYLNPPSFDILWRINFILVDFLPSNGQGSTMF